MEAKSTERNMIVAVAWTATLLASSLALIPWRELASGEPWWLPWVHVVGVTLLLALAFVKSELRPIRGYLIVLELLFILGFGGGWQFGFIPFVRASSTWTTWVSQAAWGLSAILTALLGLTPSLMIPWAFTAIVTHLLRLTPSVMILAVLLLMGRSRRGLFLVKGVIDAPAEPSKLLGMKKAEPWTRLGTTFTAIFCAGTLAFLLIVYRPSSESFIKVIPLIPVAVLIAAINAFNEEFALRAAPLSELVGAVGKHQALLITTLYFGLGHFYGIPNGVVGVLLSAFLGWFLGKSLLETKGFFWAWFIHFLQDIFIFTFVAMSA